MIQQLQKIINNKNNYLIAVILIIGILLVCLSQGKPSENYNDEEQRLENILSDIRGAGEVSVMITYYKEDEDAKAKGAVVTASGCADASVKNAISDAVSAALDLPSHKVCVYLKK